MTQTTKKETTTEVATTSISKGSTEVATQGDNALDVSNFEGFGIEDIAPENIILVQGDTTLKETMGAKNGDFVTDSNNFGKELEFIFVKSAKLLDIYTGPLDSEGKPTEYHSSINYDDAPEMFEVEGQGKIKTLFQDGEGRYLAIKVVFLIALNGMPYRLVFKGASKYLAATKIYSSIVNCCKANNLTHTSEGVFRLYSVEMMNKKINKPYQSMRCGFVRPATEEELTDISRLIQMDIRAIEAED